MDTERWQRLSPLLDALLELPTEMRSEHLAALRREDPVPADELAGPPPPRRDPQTSLDERVGGGTGAGKTGQGCAGKRRNSPTNWRACWPSRGTTKPS